MPLDAVLINVHGAMVADGYDDCEGDLLSKVRAIVGPKVATVALAFGPVEKAAMLVLGLTLILGVGQGSKIRGTAMIGLGLLLGTIGGLAINPTLYPKLSYDPVKGFAPIALYVKSPFILVVNPDLPVKNVAELIALADQAAEIGIERFVLDDGWFRHRRNDRAGLGDWYVDEGVWPDGLHPLVDRVKSHGMQFGLWFEPEMINLDSDLARAHRRTLAHHDVSHGFSP